MVAISDLSHHAVEFHAQMFVKNTFVYVEETDDNCISTDLHPRSQTSPADVCKPVLDLIEAATEPAEVPGAEPASAGLAHDSSKFDRSACDSASCDVRLANVVIANRLPTPCISVRNTFVHIEDDDDEMCVDLDRQPRSQSDPAKSCSLEELCSTDVEKEKEEELTCSNRMTFVERDDSNKECTIDSEPITRCPSSNTIGSTVDDCVNTHREVMLCMMMCPAPLALPVAPVPHLLPIGDFDVLCQSCQCSAPVQSSTKSAQVQTDKARRRKTKHTMGTHSQTNLSEMQGPDDILGGTTVVLRNLPLNYRRTMLLRMLDYEGFATKYNFVYLPADFDTGAGLGYAFINLVSPEVVQHFWKTFNGYCKWMFRSNKVCSVGWSKPHQGLATHMERFKNSPLMHESVPDEYRPILLDKGVRVPFPEPTQSLRPPSFSKSGKPSRSKNRNMQRAPQIPQI